MTPSAERYVFVLFPLSLVLPSTLDTMPCWLELNFPCILETQPILTTAAQTTDCLQTIKSVPLQNMVMLNTPRRPPIMEACFGKM